MDFQLKNNNDINKFGELVVFNIIILMPFIKKNGNIVKYLPRAGL